MRPKVEQHPAPKDKLANPPRPVVPPPPLPPAPPHADTRNGNLYCYTPGLRCSHPEVGEYHPDGTACRGWRHWWHL